MHVNLRATGQLLASDFASETHKRTNGFAACQRERKRQKEEMESMGRGGTETWSVSPNAVPIYSDTSGASSLASSASLARLSAVFPSGLK